MLLNDREIKKRCVGVNKPMISPFLNGQIKTGINFFGGEMPIISKGLSSCGYDICLSPKELLLFMHPNDPQQESAVDPKHFDQRILASLSIEHSWDGSYFAIPPDGYVLGVSVEKMQMPPDIAGIVTGKSTLARVGIIVNITPLEPGWEGYITLEFKNTLPLPVKLYANEGVAQINFHKIDLPEVSYADRKGKYQGQDDRVIFAKV